MSRMHRALIGRLATGSAAVVLVVAGVVTATKLPAARARWTMEADVAKVARTGDPLRVATSCWGGPERFIVGHPLAERLQASSDPALVLRAIGAELARARPGSSERRNRLTLAGCVIERAMSEDESGSTTIPDELREHARSIRRQDPSPAVQDAAAEVLAYLDRDQEPQ